MRPQKTNKRSLVQSLIEQRDQILPPSSLRVPPPPPALQCLLKTMDGRKGGMKCPRIVPRRHCVFCVSIIEVPLDFSSTQWAAGPIPGAAEATWPPSLRVREPIVLTDSGFYEGAGNPRNAQHSHVNALCYCSRSELSTLKLFFLFSPPQQNTRCYFSCVVQ